MNPNKSKRWVLVVIALVILGGLAAWLGPQQWRLARARHDVRVLLIGLTGFERETGRLPQGSVAEICGLLRGDNVQGQNPKRLDYIEAKSYEMNAAGEFVDPWGTPYRIATSPQPRAYSCGPNKRDEQGRGDDIVAR